MAVLGLFIWNLSRLVSLQFVLLFINAKLKEYSDWLGDNTTMPSVAGCVKRDLVCRFQYSGVGKNMTGSVDSVSSSPGCACCLQ